MASKKDRLRAREILDKSSFDPLLHLIAIAKNANTPLDLQIDACRYMLPHCHARLSDVEVSIEAPDARPTTVNILNLMPDAEARRVLEEAVLRAAARERDKRFVEESRARAIEGASSLREEEF